MEKKVIIVTGGSGLVGNGIKKVLETDKKDNEEWIFLSSKDGDLLSEKDTLRLFEKYKPTHVIHLAAQAGGFFACMKGNLDLFRNNMKINENVLSAAHQYDVKKVVSCLSSNVFDPKTTYPVDETMILNGSLHGSAGFGYSYAKRMLDVLNKAYNSQYGRQFTSVLPCNIFGPHDNFNIEDSRVLAGLIHKAYLAKKESKTFEICGTGAPLRQFVYSLDFAKLLIWAIREYDEVEPIILVPENEISIKDAALTVLDAYDFKGEVKYLTHMADGQYKKTASNAKLRRYRPDFVFTPFETAIKETVDWFVQNYDTAKI